MAVYLFTFHAYRSWMPDRQRGYVRRGEGLLPPDHDMAEHYHRDARHRAVGFTPDVQAVLVASTQALCTQKQWRLNQVMAKPTHVHTLLSWRGFLHWKSVRRTLKYRYTSELNGAFGAGSPWFSGSGSRKRVRDRAHYEFLMNEYLPAHDGIYWREDDNTPGDQNRRLS